MWIAASWSNIILLPFPSSECVLERRRYNTGEEDVDPNNFRVSDRDYEMLRKKAMEMEGLHSDGIHVSFTTMKKLVGLPLLEDEVQVRCNFEMELLCQRQ